MLHDLAKTGIVKPGKLKFAARYADPDVSNASPRATRYGRNRRTLWRNIDAPTIEFTLSTVNAAAVLCNASLLEGTLYNVGSTAKHFVLLEAGGGFCFLGFPDEAKADLQPARSAILEMRPTHTPLEEMDSEEMSEFDRNYPW